MQLPRQKLRKLPSFIKDPDFDPAHGIALDSSFRVQVPKGRLSEIGFGSDRKLDSVSLLFYPIIILQFRQIGGGITHEFVDSAFNHLGSKLSDLHFTTASRVRHKVGMIATFLAAYEKDTIPCRIPDDVHSFLRLSKETRDELMRGFGYLPTVNTQASENVGKYSSFDMPVSFDAMTRHYWIGRPGEEHVMRLGGQGAVLIQGWHVERISSALFPLFIAILKHDDGKDAYWILDCRGNHLGDQLTKLEGAVAEALGRLCDSIFQDLWEDFVANPVDTFSDLTAGFLALPLTVRADAFNIYFSRMPKAARTSTWTMKHFLPRTLAYVAQTERGPIALNRSRLNQALIQNIQDQNVKLVNQGVVSWPSLVDDRELKTSGFALMLDDQCWAFRVQDYEVGVTYYVIADHAYFRTFAIYLPDNDLLIAQNEASLNSIRHDNIRLLIMKHVVLYGDYLSEGAKKPVGRLSHVLRGRNAIHLGHFLWQDLSGIHLLLSMLEANKVPQFFIPDSALKPEIYGPLETLFPILEGKVVRRDQTFSQLMAETYSKNERLFKATSMFIPRGVGKAILSGYHASPACGGVISICREMSASAEVVVLLGLRVGNRTIIDLGSFFVNVLAAIYASFPQALVVIDGQNWSADAIYGSFGDDPTSDIGFLKQELAISGSLMDYAQSRGGKIVNNIGRPVAESLIWCEAADFFMAPWGAALAKYRWVCNKPGLVVTGRWNLRHRLDLGIYHGRHVNEEPEELWFNDPETVEDVVPANATDATLLEKSNFRILDAEAIKRQFLSLITERMRRRTTKNRSTSNLL